MGGSVLRVWRGPGQSACPHYIQIATVALQAAWLGTDARMQRPRPVAQLSHDLHGGTLAAYRIYNIWGGEWISIITSVAIFWLMLGFAVCRWEERLNCDLTGSDCQYHSPCGLMSKLAWPETAVSTAVLLFQIPTRVPCVSKALCLAP